MMPSSLVEFGTFFIGLFNGLRCFIMKNSDAMGRKSVNNLLSLHRYDDEEERLHRGAYRARRT